MFRKITGIRLLCLDADDNNAEVDIDVSGCGEPRIDLLVTSDIFDRPSIAIEAQFNKLTVTHGGQECDTVEPATQQELKKFLFTEV